MAPQHQFLLLCLGAGHTFVMQDLTWLLLLATQQVAQEMVGLQLLPRLIIGFHFSRHPLRRFNYRDDDGNRIVKKEGMCNLSNYNFRLARLSSFSREPLGVWFSIDRNVSAANCRSSSGDGVDVLCGPRWDHGYL